MRRAPQPASRAVCAGAWLLACAPADAPRSLAASTAMDATAGAGDSHLPDTAIDAGSGSLQSGDAARAALQRLRRYYVSESSANALQSQLQRVENARARVVVAVDDAGRPMLRDLIVAGSRVGTSSP